ncbi:MAG: hypothetical protein C0167_01450, partial [Nitrososphaera sp.]
GRGAEGAQAPATSKGPSRYGEDVVLRGSGWQVRKREYQGRTYYDLQVRGTWDRSPAQVLKEAIPEIQRAIKEGRINGPVGYTQWIGRKALRYLIFQDGLRVQLGNNIWAGTGLIRRVLDFMAEFNHDGGEDQEEEFANNVPSDDDEEEEKKD